MEDNIRKLRQISQPGGIAELMLEDKYQSPDGHAFSEAALVADVINIMRLNTKQLGVVFNVDISVDRMTEERAADLIEGIARNDDRTLVGAFEEIEDQQDKILEHALGEGQYQQFLRRKEKAAYSIPDSPPGNDAAEETTEKVPDETASAPPAQNLDPETATTAAEDTE